MAALSDKTIVVAIKTLIDNDSDIVGDGATKIREVFKEPFPEGVTSPHQNYAEIFPSQEGEVELNEDFELMGGDVAFLRPFRIFFTFKQMEKQNNDRLYDVVSNFRDAIKADEDLSTAGVLKAEVIGWGYEVNRELQTVQDKAIVNLNVITQESF